MGFSLTPTTSTCDRTHRGERFPRSAPEPEPSSRHLCAGHPSGQQSRHPPDLSQGNNWTLVSDCRRYAFDVSSVVHSRSPSRLTPDAITDAFSATLTTPAHSPTQLAVVCDLPLRGRSRRAHLHHRCSTASKLPSSTPEPPSAFLAHRHRRSVRRRWSGTPVPSTRRTRSAETGSPAQVRLRPQRNGQCPGWSPSVSELSMC